MEGAQRHDAHPALMAPDLLLPVWSSAAFWLLLSLLVGLLANQLPERWLRPPGRALGRGPVAMPPGIRRWKRWIPDAGPALPGGVSKASLVRRDPVLLRRLMLETRRAELVHWLLWPAGLLTALWLPADGVLVNLLFATLFNLPCLLLQRFNRRRLQRCLARIAAGQTQGPRQAASSSSVTASPGSSA
jgi:glycosyl-4,4'-diaponeurosporenoate acyltransferase